MAWSLTEIWSSSTDDNLNSSLINKRVERAETLLGHFLIQLWLIKPRLIEPKVMTVKKYFV